jgi:hypothetical protein
VKARLDGTRDSILEEISCNRSTLAGFFPVLAATHSPAAALILSS